MDGYRLCHEVRASPRFFALPFIFYTATYTSPSDEKFSLELGADKFLKKPAPVRDLLESLEEVMRSASHPEPKPLGSSQELTLMKEYNERLVAKLEQRNVELLLQSTALEAAANAIFITDAQGAILWTNPAFTRLTGYAAEEVIGRNPQMLESGEPAAVFYQELWRTIQAGQTWRGEFTNRRKDGTLYYGEQTITPVRSDAVAITHFIGIMSDVSDRKRAEAELERAHQELLAASRQAGMAELATGILHNVGNVLHSINIAATCLAESLKKSKAAGLARVVALLREHEADLGAFISSDPKGRQIPGYLAQLAEYLSEEHAAALTELEELQENIEHIKEIVSLQQNSAALGGVAEEVCATNLVEDALKMNASSLGRRGIQILREFEDAPPVMTQRHKVLQILVNLIRNSGQACEASHHADNRLTLRVAPGGNGVSISVTDNGVGIAPEHLTRIFSHGFTTKKDGHGFGLRSAALAAEELDGSLTVSSGGVGARRHLHSGIATGAPRPAGGPAHEARMTRRATWNPSRRPTVICERIPLQPPTRQNCPSPH